MAKLTKNRKISIEKVDSDKSYSLEEASTLVKEITTTKFDSSVDLAIRLGAVSYTHLTLPTNVAV